MQNNTAQTGSYDLAISRNEDPKGLQATSWCTYALTSTLGSGAAKNWADYPTLGMDGQNLSITSNQLSFTTTASMTPTFQYSRLLVLPKAKFYPDATSTDTPTPTDTPTAGAATNTP